MKISLHSLVGFIVIFACNCLQAQSFPTLVSSNAVWKYSAAGIDLGTAWSAVGYNDAAWPSGPAQLGFGDGDEATVITERPVTVYFRKTFFMGPVASAASLNLRLLYDDGAVVYLNGVEVFRVNMPAGPVAFNTVAVATAENNLIEAPIPAAVVAGTNVIAVEMHQNSITSGDLSFALQLSMGTTQPEETVLSLAVLDNIATEPVPGRENDPARIVIRRSGNLQTAIPFVLGVSGTASNGVDYLRITNEMTVPAGVTQTVVNVSALADNLVEGSETVTFSIIGPICAAVFPLPPECFTVMPPASVTVSILDATSVSNRPPVVEIVSPTNHSEFVAPADITILASANDPDGYLTIRSVELLEGTNRLAIYTNFNFVPPGPIALRWSGAPAGAYVFTAVITDNAGLKGTSAPVNVVVREGPPERTILSVRAGDASASEPGLTTIINAGHFAIRRIGNLSAGIPVYFTIGGTASNGVDYLLITNGVFIPPGATQALVTVAPLFDTFIEPVETVVLRLQVPPCLDVDPPQPQCYLIEGTNSATVFIQDSPQGTNRPPIVSIVSPTNGASFPAPQDFVIIASATDPDGYMTIRTVEFFEGTNSLGFRTNDPVLNPVGPFVLEWLKVPAGQYILTAVATDQAGARGTSAPVRITVGEPPPEQTFISIAVQDPLATEPGVATVIDPAIIAIRRSGNLNVGIPVSIHLSGTASNGIDYRFISNSVFIPAGSSQALVQVVANMDNLVEPVESVILTVETPVCVAIAPPPPECYVIAGTNRATVFIRDIPNTNTNRAPIVSLVAPAAGSTFTQGATIGLVAAAIDPGGAVRRVDFTSQGGLIGSSTNGIGTNYFAMWSNAPAGEHTLRAIATDNTGLIATSAPVSIIVVAQPPPTNVAELHVVAIYSGDVNGTSSANHETGDAAVVVNRPGSHVNLVLSAYEPVRWHVQISAGTIIDSVLLLGYYDQSVEGLPAGVPVVEITQQSNPSGYFYISPSIDSPQFLRSVQRLCGIYGRGLSSFHGPSAAEYPEPIFIDGVLSDPRLACDYPQPVDPSQLPDIRFSLTFNDGSSGAVVTQSYSLFGPANPSAKLLPTYRVVADAGSILYYGAEQHHIWKVNSQERTVQEMQIPPGLPELSWPMGAAYDSMRQRVAVATLGGEGFLYGYTPSNGQWSLIHSLENRDVDTLAYHAADDSYYAVTVGFGDYSSPRLVRFSATGEFIGDFALPQQPYGIGFSGFRSELASSGNFLVLLLETGTYVPDDGKPESRMYLIDPRAREAWLTYRRVGDVINRPPTVRILSPAEGATLPLGGATRLAAEASDSDGLVHSVQFFANGTTIGFGQRSNNSANIFLLEWNPPAPGSYLLRAQATDGGGAQAWSIPVTVGVGTNVPPATNLTFEIAFHNRDGSDGVFFRRYTLDGPLNGARLLPTTRVVPDGSGRFFYGAERQEAWQVDSVSGQVRFIHEQIPSTMEEFSWPIGAAYDSLRNRVLVGTLGGEGFLYFYAPPTGPWNLLRSLENHDLDCIVHHAADDSIYAVEPTYGGAPRLVRFDANGNYLSQIPLPPQSFAIGQAAMSSTELVSVGNYLVLLVEPNQQWFNSGFAVESRIYLIDPRTGQVRLTYQRLLPPDCGIL